MLVVENLRVRYGTQPVKIVDLEKLVRLSGYNEGIEVVTVTSGEKMYEELLNRR